MLCGKVRYHALTTLVRFLFCLIWFYTLLFENAIQALLYVFRTDTDEIDTALVRWPPMGKKKHMLEGKQRGRNELIENSISRDTGICRDRKRVSSHLQVLKGKLQGFNLSQCPFRISFSDHDQPPSIGYEFIVIFTRRASLRFSGLSHFPDS